MARRNRIYSDEDKARALVALTIHDNNIYRTSKETGIPRPTLTDWRASWDKDGVPPEIEALTATIATDYVADAERVRDAAIRELYERVNDPDISTKDLYMIFGILDDKITRARGLATKRVETVVALPDLRELGLELGRFLNEALNAAETRQGEIVMAEVAEHVNIPLALPPGSTQED